MKRKRFMKKLMAMGLTRNEAAVEAKKVRCNQGRSYAECFRRIKSGISTTMGVRRLSKAFAATGIQAARAGEAFSTLATAMASPLHEVAERFAGKEAADGTA